MSEPETIDYLSRNKGLARASTDALKKEKAIWELCRKHAQNLWDELLRENILTFKVEKDAPVTLIAVMQRNILWDVPGAWHLEDSPLPTKRSVKIVLQQVAAKIRKSLARKARKSST
jgi:hypothetical protein